MFSRRIFEPFSILRPGRRRKVAALVRAINAREYDAVGGLTSEDIVYLDTASTPLKGREQFLQGLRSLHDQAPDSTLEVDEYLNSGSDVLVKGRLLSSDPQYASESLWRICFIDGRVSEIQAFREKNAVSLPRILGRDQGKPGSLPE